MNDNIIKEIYKFVTEGGHVYYDVTYHKIIFECSKGRPCVDCILYQVSSWYTSDDYTAAFLCVYEGQELTTKELLRYLLYTGVEITRADMIGKLGTFSVVEKKFSPGRMRYSNKGLLQYLRAGNKHKP